MKTVKTPEQFKLQFQTLHPTLELLSDYINSTSTIKVKCKICGKEWTPRADTFKKIKCTTCEKSNKYKQQIAQINPNIEILDPIIYKTHDNLKCKCKVCNYIWNTASASHLKQGHGCPNCAGNLKKTPEQIKNEILKIHSNLQILNIVNCNDITVKCEECGNIRTTTLYKIKNYSKCEICSGYRMNTNTFTKRLKKINPDIEVLGEFSTTADNIEVKCKNCGRIWFSRAGKLLEGQKCICNSESKGELLVKSILKKINIDFIQEYMLIDSYFSQYKLYIDFYIPSKNLFIEYNGIQHYQPVDFGTGGNVEDIYNKQITRDSELKEYCDLHNIKLLEIKYTLNEDEVENLIKETLNII